MPAARPPLRLLHRRRCKRLPGQRPARRHTGWSGGFVAVSRMFCFMGRHWARADASCLSLNSGIFQDLDVEAFMTPRSTQNSRGHLAKISAWRTRIQSSHSEGQAVVQDGQPTPEQTYQSVPRLPTRKRDSAMHQRLRPPVHLCRFTQIESSDDWRVATGFPPATTG